jgi:hypothetical protein
MRPILIPLALAMTALGLATTPAPAASRCRGEAIVKTSKVVVIAKRGRAFYACARQTGRSRRFATEDRAEGPLIRNVTASGRFVAWEERGGRTEPFSIVCTFDGISGGRPKCFNATTDGVLTDPLAPHQVARLLVTSSGHLAWTADNQRADPPRPEVHKVDAQGPALLDSGAGVNRSSLRVSGTRVLWTNSGVEQSAPFHTS